MTEQNEKPPSSPPSKEELKESLSAKISGSSLGTGSEETPKRGRPKGSKARKREPEQSDVDAVRRCIRQLFSAIDALTDKKATRETRDEACRIYLRSSAEVLLLKWAGPLTPWAEELNFGAASLIWTGNKVAGYIQDKKAATPDLAEQAKGLMDLAQNLGIGSQQEIESTEVKGKFKAG